MERYKKFGKEFKTNSGAIRHSSVYYPFIPYRDSDIYLYAKRSDRLDLLAYRYYKDVSLWWVIASANNIGKGTLLIEPGRIRIPYPVNDYIIDRVILEDNDRQSI